MEVYFCKVPGPADSGKARDILYHPYRARCNYPPCVNRDGSPGYEAVCGIPHLEDGRIKGNSIVGGIEVCHLVDINPGCEVSAFGNLIRCTDANHDSILSAHNESRSQPYGQA